MSPEKIKKGVYTYLDAVLYNNSVMSFYNYNVMIFGPEIFTDPSWSEKDLHDAKNEVVFCDENKKYISLSFEPSLHNKTSIGMRTMLIDNITSALGVNRNYIIPHVEGWALELFEFIEFPLGGKVSNLIKKRNENKKMKKTIKLTESQFFELINQKIQEQKTGNYMFFSNLKQMRRQIDKLLSLEPQIIEELLQNGHDWADDHVATATENMDQVFDFIMNEEDEFVSGPLDENTKREPTNKKLWSKAKSLAKSKYKVWPSAYASGWAAKWYKKQGGNWKNK